MQTDINQLSERVIGACIEVHKILGPGLYEHVYADCLALEMKAVQIPFERELQVPIAYKGYSAQNAFRLDFLIDRRLVVELKSVEKMDPIFKTQVITYLRLGHFPLGLLINFNVARLIDGVSRIAGEQKSVEK